jgi:hypothetical protein
MRASFFAGSLEPVQPSCVAATTPPRHGRHARRLCSKEARAEAGLFFAAVSNSWWVVQPV